MFPVLCLQDEFQAFEQRASKRSLVQGEELFAQFWRRGADAAEERLLDMCKDISPEILCVHVHTLSHQSSKPYHVLHSVQETRTRRRWY